MEYHYKFFWTTMTYERESSTRYNSLHNTKTTQNVFNIILWRLLLEILKFDAGDSRIADRHLRNTNSVRLQKLG